MSRNQDFADGTLADGGGTMNATTGKQYKGEGYSVGGSPGLDGRQIPTVIDDPKDFTAKRVAEHRKRILHETKGNKDASVGTWLHEGKIQVDASDTVLSRAQAMVMAKDRNQIAIYDHAKGADRKTWGRAIR